MESRKNIAQIRYSHKRIFQYLPIRWWWMQMRAQLRMPINTDQVDRCSWWAHIKKLFKAVKTSIWRRGGKVFEERGYLKFKLRLKLLIRVAIIKIIKIQASGPNTKGCHQNPNSMRTVPSKAHPRKDGENINVLLSRRSGGRLCPINEYCNVWSPISRAWRGKDLCYLQKAFPRNQENLS